MGTSSAGTTSEAKLRRAKPKLTAPHGQSACVLVRSARPRSSQEAPMQLMHVGGIVGHTIALTRMGYSPAMCPKSIQPSCTVSSRKTTRKNENRCCFVLPAQPQDDGFGCVVAQRICLLRDVAVVL